ncbi:MAG TPA: HEPN domain-containing protein [bacterium]|nr:HEPN domain-containing protein [bacterium]
MDTARAMPKSGRLLYVLFCCQQAVEKMLKGIIAKWTEAFPPRLHNLIRLAEPCGTRFGAGSSEALGGALGILHPNALAG